MDDDVRRTWAAVLATIGVTMLAAFGLRLWLWHHDRVRGDYPEVLWTLGALALGLLLSALMVLAEVWEWRKHKPTARPDEQWGEG